MGLTVNAFRESMGLPPLKDSELLFELNLARKASPGLGQLIKANTDEETGKRLLGFIFDAFLLVGTDTPPEDPDHRRVDKLDFIMAKAVELAEAHEREASGTHG